MRNALISGVFLFSIGMVGCAAQPTGMTQLTRTEYVVIEPDPRLIQACVGRITRDDVPDPDTATENDHTRYTKKLEAAYLICKNNMLEIQRNARKAKEDIANRQK